jgi:GntR family transcriptional repressor for pyruvate dehydrogenase complex
MTQRRRSVNKISDSVAEELEARILEGSLKPGDRLPAERDLAVEMGVSRPSLREALQKLVSKGLLATRHGGGTVVTDRLEATFVDPWQQMLKGHPALQSDLLEFRRMLESQAAALAAERATPADIERIDTAFATLDAAYASGDLVASAEADVAFHQAVAEAAHNALIGHLCASLHRVIHDDVSANLGFLHARAARWDKLKAQHRAIWEAVRNRHGEAAGSVASAHIDFVRESMAEAAKDVERRHTAARRLGETT